MLQCTSLQDADKESQIKRLDSGYYYNYSQANWKNSQTWLLFTDLL